jgi:hypothetical protein
MVDKNKELSEKDLKKATGGAGDRRPVLKTGHTNSPNGPVLNPDDADSPQAPSTNTPRTRPGTKINPV